MLLEYQSKRMPLRKKYKIERKCREYKRKLRREARKNPQKRKKLKKDPGIPNLWPYKEELLQRIHQQAQEREDELRKRREQRMEEEQLRQKNDRLDEQMRRRLEEVNELERLQKDAERRDREFAKKSKEKDKARGYKDPTRNLFYREFKKVVKASDVILEVLDARDPNGTRCPAIEQSILQQDPNKRIVLVLNKIDLVPKVIIQKWLAYLRNEFPTIAFKCSTQKQRKKMGQKKLSALKTNDEILQNSECLGAETLITLLKNYCRSLGMKKTITVGIIGIPNVGKSSLINSLKRAKAVDVGATPGVTRTMQEVVLDTNIRLLDCPGIIFSDDTNEIEAALRNSIDIKQLKDRIAPVQAILDKVPKEHLMELYKIPAFNNVNDFLSYVAHRRGKLSRGGIADLDSAAKVVLQDWNEGRIPFYTTPPAPKIIKSEIVTEWGKAFNIEEISKMENDVVITKLNSKMATGTFAELPTSQSFAPHSELLNMNFNAPDNEAMDVCEEDESASDGESDDDHRDSEEKSSDDDEMEEDSDNLPLEELLSTPTKEKKTHRKLKLQTKEDELNPQYNKLRRKQQKQERKRNKKLEKRQERQEYETYNFDLDFWRNNSNVNTDTNTVVNNTNSPFV
jgi:nuclear GTP-binding protein